MNDLLDVAIMVTVFALGIGLVLALSAMIERHCDGILADEPPETGNPRSPVYPGHRG